MLIIPPVEAHLLIDRLLSMLILSALLGVMGYFLQCGLLFQFPERWRLGQVYVMQGPFCFCVNGAWEKN
ncbi:hypothetical protein [Bacillus tequilensis]|uniref:hypothetical protein n=1 Tax=Bacillus tequilensis TaxID=227866 RepID=UPI00266F2C65|nr:hypothetical protein [Bacillus tequilensis]